MALREQAAAGSAGRRGRKPPANAAVAVGSGTEPLEPDTRGRRTFFQRRSAAAALRRRPTVRCRQAGLRARPQATRAAVHHGSQGGRAHRLRPAGRPVAAGARTAKHAANTQASAAPMVKGRPLKPSKSGSMATPWRSAFGPAVRATNHKRRARIPRLSHIRHSKQRRRLGYRASAGMIVVLISSRERFGRLDPVSGHAMRAPPQIDRSMARSGPECPLGLDGRRDFFALPRAPITHNTHTPPLNAACGRKKWTFNKGSRNFCG